MFIIYLAKSEEIQRDKREKKCSFSSEKLKKFSCDLIAIYISIGKKDKLNWKEPYIIEQSLEYSSSVWYIE